MFSNFISAGRRDLRGGGNGGRASPGISRQIDKNRGINVGCDGITEEGWTQLFLAHFTSDSDECYIKLEFI